MGGTFLIENCRLITAGDGVAFGVVHLSVTRRETDVLISVKDCIIENLVESNSMRAVTISIGSEDTKDSRVDVEIDGLRTTNKIMVFLNYPGLADISQKASCIVDNVFSPVGASLVGASNPNNYNMPMRLQRQSGVQNLTASTGTASSIGGG